MDDLIEALTIFRKYGNPYSPTHCGHDELLVNIDPEIVTMEDKSRLYDLSFRPNNHDEFFTSFRFGSC